MKIKLLFGVLSAFVAGAAAQDMTPPKTDGENVQYYRELWRKRTQGNILSAGKKVSFSIPTNYRLTNDENDPFDLTDGKISASAKEHIWFGKEPVGWFGGVSDSGVNFLIDLGEVKNVDRMVIRCLGGEVQKTLGFPKRFEVYVSKDGKNYYRTALLQKLAESDRALSDFKYNFYLQERGKAYVYPFELDINAQARYVAFTIASSAGGLFADEMAVMEGDPEKKGFNEVYENDAVPFYIDGVMIRPKLNELVFSKNVITPVFFTFCDMRKIEQKKSPMMLQLDLPAGVSLISPKAEKVETYKAADSERLKITVKAVPRPWSANMLQPMYFRVEKDIPKGSIARFTSYSEGVEPIVQEFPFNTIDIEPVPPLKRIHVSLAWMGDGDARTFPEFIKTWKTLGFNAVNGFPNHFGEKTRVEREKFFDEVRKAGLKVVMTDSPIHAMPGKGKKGHEMNCLVDNIVAVCPSYKGPFHEREVERIRRCVVKSKPDYVFFDIEAFYSSHVTAKRCSRCLAAMKEAGMTSMDDFTKKVVAEKLADFHDAVRRGAEEVGIPCPPVGLYGMSADSKDGSQPVLSWKHFYPKYVELAQPSLYVGERPWLVNSRIRKSHKLMKNRNIIPWLTAGTYGEMRPQFVEYIALEALMNGAGGFTYYAFWDFDTPREYAAMAKALRMIAPYEDLIMDGELVDIAAEGVDVSAIRKGNEMLLLVGNYRQPDTNVTLNLPFKKVNAIIDLRNGGVFKPGTTLKLDVPRSDIRLLHIKGR